MSNELSILWRQAHRRLGRRATDLRRDQSGSTAVEFAMVSFPFMALLFGIIAVGLFFFTTFSLENAVEQASRQLRTGEAQTAGMTKDQFKSNVCAPIQSYIDCAGKLRVNVQKYNLGEVIVQPSCTDGGGNLTPDADSAYLPGAANQIMLVTACLQWDLAGKIPFLTLSSMGNGAALIMASTTFKIEPYN
ncbi:MAG: TadE/TadG family type IV pilus assembly protein [Hyphomicrobiaceae bacterium]